MSRRGLLGRSTRVTLILLGLLVVFAGGTCLLIVASGGAKAGRRGGRLPIKALRTKAEPLPPRLREEALETLGKEAHRLGLRLAAAQHLRTAIGISEWVVPGRDVTCLFRGGMAAVACNKNTLVRRKGLMVVVGEGKSQVDPGLPDRFLALGLVPDGTSSVRLHEVNGSSKVVPVVGNTFAYQAKTPFELEKLIR